MKDERKYEIWMRNYPQPDVNISEEWEIPPCKSLKKAKELCEELEANYADEGWKGNRLYKAICRGGSVMYYRVKNVSVKGNKLFVTAAANNVRPITYSKEEYDAKEEDLRKKVRSFAISALEGNFQATGRCNKESFWEYAETIKVKYQLLESNFSCDRLYDLNRESELEELIADLVLVPLFFDEPVDFDEAKRILTNFDQDSKFMYEVIEKRFKEEGKIIVTSAWRCDIIPGTDVVYTKDNKWYLCKADHYNNHGVLDNADNSAIEFDGNNYELRRVLLGYDINKETFDEINKLKEMMEKTKNYPQEVQ